MKAVVSFGYLRRKNDYDVLETGFDWYKVRAQGKVQFVPKWVLDNVEDDDTESDDEY